MVCVSVCDVGNQEHRWNFKQEHICREQFNSGLPHAIQKCHHNKQLIVSVTGSRKRHIRSAQFPQNALWFSHRMAQCNFLFALLDIVLTRWEIHTEHIALPFVPDFFVPELYMNIFHLKGLLILNVESQLYSLFARQNYKPWRFLPYSHLFLSVSKICGRMQASGIQHRIRFLFISQNIEQLDTYDTIFVILNFTSFLWHFVNIRRWKSLLWDVFTMVSVRKMFYFLSLLGIL
jgi:hypothetical protein